MKHLPCTEDAGTVREAILQGQYMTETQQGGVQAHLDGLRERDLRPLGVQLGLKRRRRQRQRDHLGIHVTKRTKQQGS